MVLRCVAGRCLAGRHVLGEEMRRTRLGGDVGRWGAAEVQGSAVRAWLAAPLGTFG